MKLSTRIIAAALLLLLSFPLFIFQASAKEVTVSADAINAARESGALVIYTPEMGATTGTNEWGYEVIIEDNVAVKFSNGNSAIPANGFVLSGHDEEASGKRMGQWIKDNIAIGDYVYYSPSGAITVSDKPIAESLFYTLTQDILGTNVTRSENALVVYNKRGTTTGTNDWGYEVVCTEGVVTAMGGNNNTVPDKPNSCVVSAHGTMVVWLQDNVNLGMSVSYDTVKKTVSFSYDEAAAVAGMDIRIKGLWEDYEAALERYDYFNYSSAKAAIEELENTVATVKSDFKKSQDAGKLVEGAISVGTSADDIALLISESKTVEYRGVWIRPTDTSAEQVEATVQSLYEKGINMICIETLYDCTMIMPMPEDSLFETNPKFRHFDMLQAYIDACHKRGMELHLWLPVYYVGDSGSSNLKYSLGKKMPEWLSVSNTGKYSYQVVEAGVEGSGLMMLDPSNEEASNYLLNTYKYILETYDVDGFQLDYIRYYVRGTDYDMGYTKEALDAFEEKYGVRPKYDENASYWNDWVNFRCEYINSFVQRIRKLIDDTRPGVLLGADVVPDPSESITHNYQNYYDWLENKWIDILFPMSYGYGHEEDIAAQVVRCSENSFIAVGLGIFMTELTPVDMQAQAVYNSSVNADGSVYFEASAYSNKGTGEHLLKGVYRTSAITPTFDVLKGAQAQADYMKSRINDIIIPLGGVSEDKGAAIVSAIDALKATLTAEGFDSEKFNAVKTAIDESGAKEEAASRMNADLKMIIKAYTVLNKELDMSGVPEISDVPDYTDNSKSDISVSVSESDESVDESASDNENAGDSSSAVIIIVAIVVVIAVIVVAVVVLKKGKK